MSTTSFWSRVVLTLTAVLLASGLYSPIATSTLSAWLTDQIPKPPPMTSSQAVFLGRGSVIASATTAMAANLVRQGRAY